MSSDYIAAWDTRDRLLEELKEKDSLPVRTLYIRRDDGGALALGLLSDRRGAVLIELHAASYELSILREPALLSEPYEKKAAGFGGVFGIGEKGSNGWMIKLTEHGKEVREIILLPYITSFADLAVKGDKFLCGKRKPRQIPLWQPRPEDRYTCEAVLTLWERFLREGI